MGPGSWTPALVLANSWACCRQDGVEGLSPTTPQVKRAGPREGNVEQSGFERRGKLDPSRLHSSQSPSGFLWKVLVFLLASVCLRPSSL